MFLWWPDKNHYSLAGKFWFLHHIPQTLNLQISIYFDLYKILSMEKNSVLWKTAKGTWNSSFLKKIKSFGKMELRSCLKNGRRQWNKMVNTLFSSWWKWKMCLLFLLKNQGNILANPISISVSTYTHTFFICSSIDGHFDWRWNGTGGHASFIH